MMRWMFPLLTSGSAGVSFSDRLADRVARFVGSWSFIVVQSVILAAWIVSNALGWLGWDPWPFVFCNLVLSFEAAYTAPIIMMSQNRQNVVDRDHAEKDYSVDRDNGARLERIERLLEEISKR